MKYCKKSLRLVAAFLSAAIAASMACVPALAAGRTPAGYVQEDPDCQSEYAEAIERIYQGTMDFEEAIYVGEFHIPIGDCARLLAELVGTHAELSVLLDTTHSYQIGAFDDLLVALFPVYSAGREEAETRLQAFYDEADRYLSLVDDSMDEFTKAVVLHDAMILDAEYLVAKRYENGEEVYSDNYHQMMEKWGRCETYTEIYAYLLAQLGIRTEIVDSGAMNHEWLKVRLDGKYYNADLTFDDPVPDRPGMVSHTYFLYSDEAFSADDETIGRQAHVDYPIRNLTDTRYDNAGFHRYHTRMCLLNGKLYAIDRNTGELVSYDHKTDVAVPLKQIGDKWDAGQGYTWIGCFSGLEVCGGLLYYNTPDAVYSYDPVTGQTEKIAGNTFENEFYGVLVKDGKLYGVVAESPNVTGSLVYLTTLETDPQPTEPVATDPQPTEPAFLPGDVDGDGRLNIVDATEIQRFIADLTEFTPGQREAADYNADGQINITDATAIQYAIAQ